MLFYINCTCIIYKIEAMIKGMMTKDALVLLFLFFSLTVAIIIKSLQKVWKFIPYTPTLFVASILMGKFSYDLGIIGQAIEATATIDPRGILLIFLPPLVFESSFNSDWYVFRRQAKQIFILAFPSVLISAFTIMFCIKVLIGYDDTYYDYPQAFMFGAVLSCTDTVAVLALLKEAGAPKKFSSLIEGESLLNDGSCMILFTISLQICKGFSMGPIDITVLFLELTCGAVILGVIFGIIATEFIKLFKNQPLLCYNITLVGCYLVYFTAEYVDLGIHISGIMSLVAMGLYIAAFGKTKFPVQAKQRVGHIWKVYVFVAETVIFILGGTIVGSKALNNPRLIDLIGTQQLIYLLLLYLSMMFARFFSIAVFMWKLANLGYGLIWKEVIALTYGGLRGAVGIAFTLILASNMALPQKFRYISVFNISGCAFLTLMINAPTCSSVIIKLGLCNKSDAKIKLFNKFMFLCRKQLRKKVEESKSDKYLKGSNWDTVDEWSGLKDLDELIAEQRMKRDDAALNQIQLKKRLVSDNSFEQDELDSGTKSQIRRRFGLALKGVFWRKFEKRECSDETIKKLIQCINLDLDSSDQPLNTCDYLISHQQSTIFYDIMYWLRKFPLINKYAFSVVYQRVSSIYQLVSTYIEGLDECERQAQRFPFDRMAREAIVKQSAQNRVLAQNYLQTQIKNSFPDIMKKIKKSKISVALLNHQIQLLDQNYKQGRVDEVFYLQMRIGIEKRLSIVEDEVATPDQLITPEQLASISPFSALTKEQFKQLLKEHEVKLLQKDQHVVRSYQRMKYLYYVAKGDVNEEWKLPQKVYVKREIRARQYLGLGELYRNTGVDYSATSLAVTCLYGFPLTRIRELMTTNADFQRLVYREMLPVIIQLTKQIDIPYIPHDTWARIKERVEFIKLSKEQTHRIEFTHIILIEGSIQIGEKTMGVGHYKIGYNFRAKIRGPARYFKSSDPFSMDVIRNSNLRRSDAISSFRRSSGPTIYQQALFAKQ